MLYKRETGNKRRRKEEGSKGDGRLGERGFRVMMVLGFGVERKERILLVERLCGAVSGWYYEYE